MCARYSFSQKKIRQVMHAMAELRDLIQGGVLKDKINHTPNTAGPVILERGGERRIEAMDWGLLVPWQASPVVNAQSETAGIKKTFASSMHRRRCLVISDAFYEWETVGRKKLPWEFSLPGEPLVMAGIWNLCHTSEGEPVERYCILTTTANETLKKLHDRMPVILSPNDWSKWIDTSREAEELKPLLRPWDGEMKAREISPKINSVHYQEGSIEIEPTNTDEPVKPIQGELF